MKPATQIKLKSKQPEINQTQKWLKAASPFCLFVFNPSRTVGTKQIHTEYSGPWPATPLKYTSSPLGAAAAAWQTA